MNIIRVSFSLSIESYKYILIFSLILNNVLIISFGVDLFLSSFFNIFSDIINIIILSFKKILNLSFFAPFIFLIFKI